MSERSELTPCIYIYIYSNGINVMIEYKTRFTDSGDTLQ